MDWRRELMGGLSSGININNYLTIEALEDGLTASLSVNACEYCVDGDGNWKSLAADTATESINIGQTLSFRGELTPTSSNGIGTFTISKQCNLKGNCMSMLFGNNAAKNYSLSGKSYAFYKLFYNCTNIVNVNSNFLPATTLANYCYKSMFEGCTKLIATPNLTAITLENATGCYEAMFKSCTSLSEVCDLPATTLYDMCYAEMFKSCVHLSTGPKIFAKKFVRYCCESMFEGSGLESIPDFLTTEVTEYCCRYMFKDCAWLTTAPALPATSINGYGAYRSMFNGCWRLINAPDLPATKLGSYCYYEMFKGCTNLVNAPELPATNLYESCYRYMFQSCRSLTTAPKLPATRLDTECYQNMFRDCTNLTTAPELPATTLAEGCYRYMFYDCTSLNSITMLATDISANNCLSGWVTNVASSGTFVKNTAMTSLPTGINGIPSGWTVKDHIFTFTFDGDTYTAEYNMTIAEWIESDYNTGGYYIYGGFIYGPNGSSDSCFPSDIIEEGDRLVANAPA